MQALKKNLILTDQGVKGIGLSQPPQKKLTGISPVIEKSFPLSHMTMVNARTAAIFDDRFVTHPPKKSWIYRLSESPKLNRFIDHWIVQQCWFAMNKLSIVGLITGLMFLGAIFFAVGFLTAYKTFPPPFEQPSTPQVWASASQSASGLAIGTGKTVLGVESNMLMNRMQSSGIGATGKMASELSHAQSHIPAPLKPFAKMAAVKTNRKATQTVSDASIYSRQQVKKTLSGQQNSPHPSLQPPAQAHIQAQRHSSQPLPQQHAFPSQQGYAPQPYYPQQGQGQLIQQGYPPYNSAQPHAQTQQATHPHG